MRRPSRKAASTSSSRTGAWSPLLPASRDEQKAAVIADIEKMVNSASLAEDLADKGWARHLSRRRRLRTPSSKKDTEATDRDPEGHRPGEMSQDEPATKQSAAPIGRRWSSPPCWPRSPRSSPGAPPPWHGAANYARVGPTTFPYAIAVRACRPVDLDGHRGLARRFSRARAPGNRPDPVDRRRTGRADAAAQGRRASRSPPACCLP